MIDRLSPELEQFSKEWDLWKNFLIPTEKDSIGVVVGAYKGKLMEFLLELFPEMDVIGFEPQPWAFEEARKRLEKYGARSSLWNFGLGVVGSNVDMGEWGTDACSAINNGPDARQWGKAVFGDTTGVFNQMGLQSGIDLMVMNIEGYEYLLLPYLYEEGWLDKIDRLAVQFHFELGINQTEKVMDEIIESMTDKYNIIVDDRPTWVYFEKKR